ncbi:MAG TPA: 50S ribosomal protein L29 [bacterium]|nr:50S ribosomal protein L29 [bacterium]
MEKLGNDRLREMAPEELSRHLRDLQEELFNIRVRRSLQPPANPLLLRHLRRQIARVKTVMNQRQAQA